MVPLGSQEAQEALLHTEPAQLLCSAKTPFPVVQKFLRSMESILWRQRPPNLRDQQVYSSTLK